MVEPIVENRRWIISAALFGASAVVLGAFGSHGLRDLISSQSLATWRTGVEYQMFHAVALLALAVSGGDLRRWRWTLRLWSGGILLFAGSLYALALSGQRPFGLVTPLGGLCFIAGWLFLVWAPRQRERRT